MLNSAEKRFIKYWEEQREGGKTKYYLLYILAGTFIGSLVLSFLYVMTVSMTMALDWTVVPITIASFLIVTILTVVTWQKNEKKFKAIIKREIQEAQSQDDKKEDNQSVEK